MESTLKNYRYNNNVMLATMAIIYNITRKLEIGLDSIISEHLLI